MRNEMNGAVLTGDSFILFIKKPAGPSGARNSGARRERPQRQAKQRQETENK